MFGKTEIYFSKRRRSFSSLVIFLSVFLMMSLFSLSQLYAAEEDSSDVTVLAITPFENLSGNSDQGYVAFQIYEFMTTLFSEIEEWKVVERKDLKKVFDEQEFQLSGITKEEGAAKLGSILNAGNILSGSYLIEGDRITLYGRIIDTESGEVVQSSQAEDSFNNGAGPAMEKLFYALTGRYTGSSSASIPASNEKPLAELLLSALEENRWSADIEARLELIRSRGEDVSRDLARALESDFAGNDEETLSRLEALVREAKDNPIGFTDTADRYYEQYTRLRGETIYAKMLKQQLDLNSKLSRESEALTLYRNKIRILSDTLYSLLQPEMFGLDQTFEADIEIEGTSAVVKLPESIEIETEKSLQKLIEKFIKEHDLIWSYNGKNEFHSSRQPDVSTLLPEVEDIQDLVNFTLEASIGFSMEFLDGEGDILFALDSEPAGSIFSLTTGGELRFARKLKDLSYQIRQEDPLWELEGTQLRIRPEALKQLASVRRVINPDSFSAKRLFPLYSNSRWRSLILHAFRLRFSPLGEEDRPFPEVKEVALSNSVFKIPGVFTEGTEWIPLLPSSIGGEPQLLPGEDLRATVYWGAKSEAVIEAAWKGDWLEEREAVSFTKQLEEGSVFTLSAPSASGEGSLILEDKRSGGIIETPFRVAPRGGVILRDEKKGKRSFYLDILPDRHSGESYLLKVETNRTDYGSSPQNGKLMVERSATGDTVWSRPLRGTSFRHTSRVGIVKKERTIEVFDLLSGNELYRINDIHSDLELPEQFQDKKYKDWLEGYSLHRVADSAEYILWTIDSWQFGDYLLFSLHRPSGTVVVRDFMEADTLELQGDFLHLYREQNNMERLTIIDLRSGDVVIDNAYYRSNAKILFRGETLYVLEGGTAYKVSLGEVKAAGRISDRGDTQWSRRLENVGRSSASQLFLREGRLYTVRNEQEIACIDAASGELIWETSHGVGKSSYLNLDKGVLRFSGFDLGEKVSTGRELIVHWYMEIDPASGKLLLEGQRTFEPNWSANSTWESDPLAGPRGKVLFYSKGRRGESSGGYMLLSREVDPALTPALEADKLYEEVLF